MSKNANHKAKKGKRHFCLYTVYDNQTGFPVIVCGTARECAKAMGMTYDSFFCAVNRAYKGIIKRWYIERYYVDELEEEE